jgi:hypothetical protein
MSIPAHAEIRRNADGVVRRYDLGSVGFYGDFVWSDGDYSCDCNRGIFFCSVAGEDDSNRKCGDTAYSVKITANDGGRVLYEDDGIQAAT